MDTKRNWLWRLLNLFRGESATQVKADKLTNKYFLSELVALFRERLEDMSVGNKMLYPMSFNIVMHESDYANMKDTLRFVLAEVVTQFEQTVIADYKTTYPDFTPPAKNWTFQISGSKLEKIALGNGDVLEIKKGKITIIEAGVYSFETGGEASVQVDDNIRVSVRVKDSDVYKNININRETLVGFESFAEGVFRFPFDHSLSKKSQEHYEQSNLPEVEGLATLSYMKEGKNTTFTMKDALVNISGKNETRNGRAIFKVDYEDILDSHVQIKYISANKKYQIAAFGPVRLNGRKLDISSGGDMRWYDLANRSGIFINDLVSVKFEIKE